MSQRKINLLGKVFMALICAYVLYFIACVILGGILGAREEYRWLFWGLPGPCSIPYP